MGEGEPVSTHRQEQGPGINIRSYWEYRGMKLKRISALALRDDAADGEDLSEILQSPNSKAGKKLQTGNFYYFFGAAEDGMVPYIHWYWGKFVKRTRSLETATWGEFYYAVLKK